MSEPILFRRGIRNYWRLPYVLRVVLIAPVAAVHALSMGVLGFIEGFGDGLGIAAGSTRSDKLLDEWRSGK